MLVPQVLYTTWTPSFQSAVHSSNFLAVDRKHLFEKKSAVESRAHRYLQRNIHQRADFGVRRRVYRFKLVQHFAYNDDARPHSAHAGGQGAIVAVRQGKGPGHQKDIIQQRHLHRRRHEENKVRIKIPSARICGAATLLRFFLPL